jgi:hypothetical protein
VAEAAEAAEAVTGLTISVCGAFCTPRVLHVARIQRMVFRE